MTAAVNTRNGNSVDSTPADEDASVATPERKSSYILRGKHTAHAVALIDAAHKNHVMPMIWGIPGTGKTSLVRALSNRSGYAGVIVLLAGTMDRSDILGMPMRSTYKDPATGAETETTVYATPQWAIQANAAEGKIYIFLDELRQAEQEVQGVLLTVIQDRVMPSGFKLNDNVLFIGAANPADSVESGFDLIEPLQNRMMHFTYEPPAREWFRGMTDAWGVKISPQEATLRRMIVAYITSDPNNALHKPPQSGSLEQAWPSRRSWDNFARVGAELSADPDLLAEAATAFLGKAAGTAFIAAITSVQLPPPEKIVADPRLIDWLDALTGHYALASIVAWASNAEELKMVARVFNYAASTGPRDIAVNAVDGFMSRVTEIQRTDKKADSAFMELDRVHFKEPINMLFGKK